MREVKIEEAIINGVKVEVLDSDFTANEFVIDFLRKMGPWDILTGMPIKMGKNNGYPGKVVLGILILKELMAIRKIAGAGKVIQDGKFGPELTSTLKKSKKHRRKIKGIIDLRILSNHSKRAAQGESEKAF